MIFITEGAGFIESNFVFDWLAQCDEPVFNIDKLTYAGNLENYASLQGDARHIFVRGDLGDRAFVDAILAQQRPRAVLHFVAESHLDRSIHGPEDYIRANIVGTFRLLEAVRSYWSALPEAERVAFRFLHVSTDEVFGRMSREAKAFAETNRYEPNSAYNEINAASDCLVRAWHNTYDLPVHVDDIQIRDWLYVKDHCSAISTVLAKGQLGETYNVGGWNEKPNIEIVNKVCKLLDELRPKADSTSYAAKITYVSDRPSQDRRYAIDARKLERELDWKPTETFETGIRKTVEWYLANPEWVADVQSGAYREWVAKQYEEATT